MSEKRIQKSFYFRNEETKNLIEGLLNDEAESTNRSTSYLIEQHIMEDFLPENKLVASWIMMLYNAEGNETDLADIMILVFSTIAGLNKYKSANINYKPLIEFCFKNQCLSKIKAELDEPSMEKLVNPLGNVIERLKIEYDDRKDPEITDKNARLNIDIKELNRIRETDKLTAYDMNTVYITTLNNWDILYDWFYTYSMFTAMLSLQPLNNTAETRLQLVKLLNDLAKYID